MSRPKLLADESGSALVASLAILLVISMLGAVVALSVNVQTHQTGNERAGEQAFNLAESALNAEASLLETTWPSSSASAYPVCTQSSTTSSTCPQGGISAGYSPTYAWSGFASPTWSVQVIDDNVPGVADANFYSDAILSSSQLQHYDSNSPPDNKLWIRASATIGGQKRSVVALIQRQQFVVDLPQSVLTSGGVYTSNNGNKVIIQGTDPLSGLTGAVDIRCSPTGTDPPGSPSYQNPCAGWDPSKGQLSPTNDFQVAYSDPSTTYQTLSNGVIEQLRQAAQANGTYYPAGTCPPLNQPGLLFVENANCSYNGSGTTPNWNSDSAPGAIVVASGTLTFNANINFYGIIYMADGQGTVPASGLCDPTDTSNTVFTVHGGGSIHGGVFVDKCGLINAGDSGFDIKYDTKAFGGLATYATPSLAENTFRILGNS